MRVKEEFFSVPVTSVDVEMKVAVTKLCNSTRVLVNIVTFIMVSGALLGFLLAVLMIIGWLSLGEVI
jgi:hypothetical protein